MSSLHISYCNNYSDKTDAVYKGQFAKILNFFCHSWQEIQSLGWEYSKIKVKFYNSSAVRKRNV